MSKEIIARRMLLGMGAGVGAMALAARRAEADVPFSSFAFAATGSPTARTMPDRLAEIKNVKDFGARGNGSTDDTAAIQAAVNWTGGANRGTVHFPLGTYRITAPITFETNPINIRFLGEPGATITGSFADALLKRSDDNPTGGVHSVENLTLTNYHANGKALMFHKSIPAKVVNCHINAWRGIETWDSQSITIDSCKLLCPAQAEAGTSIAIDAGNATTVLNCDITHYGTGIRHHNLGLTVLGGRYEVNGTAILLGKDMNGDVYQSTGFLIAGLSMESNDHAIYINSGSAGQISGCAITSNFNGNHSGIYMATAEQISVSGCVVTNNNDFTDAAIYMGDTKRISFDAVKISVAGGAAWRLPTDGRLASCSFRATDPVVEGSVTWAQINDAGGEGTNAPVGTILRVSNSNTSTIGAKITSSGAHNVMALKIHGKKWTVLGPGT